jgi:hypothetical protein
MTRAPAGTVTTPGRRTFPLTATTSECADVGEAAGPAAGPAAAPVATGGGAIV